MSQTRDPFEHLSAAELHVGDGLTSWRPRAAGLVSLLAVGFWGWFTIASLDEVGKAVIMTRFGAWMDLNQPVEVPIDTERKVDTVEDARGVLSERIQARQSLREARQRQLLELRRDSQSQEWVQTLTTAVWLVIMIVTGVVLLASSLAGLTGSPRTRRWHAAAAKWIVLATAASAAGVFILARWGGFPMPDDYGYLALLLSMQLAYAVYIFIALLATRRAHADTADRATVAARLQAPSARPAAPPPVDLPAP
jgi:hypothetical protein